MRRLAATGCRLCLAVAVVLSAVAATGLLPAATATAPDDPQVSITGVEVVPEQPVTGQSVELRPTILNAKSSPQNVDISAVYVERIKGGEDPTIARSERLGTLTAGGSVTVPLRVSFDEPGVKRLRVNLVAQGQEGGNVILNYPTTVVVSEGGPQVSLNVGEPAAGGERPVSVDVSNGEGVEFRSLDLSVNGSNVAVEDPRRVAAALGPGETRTFDYTATFPEAGSSAVTATLQYQPVGGEARTVTETVRTRVRDADLRMDLTVQERTVGSDRPVVVNVSNGEEVRFRDLSLSVGGSDVSVEDPTRFAAAVAPGTDRSFSYAATFDEPGTRTVEATLSYATADGATRTLTAADTVDVVEGGADLSVRVADPAVGRETPVVVDVANQDRGAIEDLALTVNGSNVRLENRQRLVSDLGADANRSFTYAATFPEEGRSTVEARLRYTAPDGERRTTRQTETVELERTAGTVNRPQVGLSVPDAIPGATRPVNVTVANGLEAEVRQLSVRASSPTAEFSVSERVRSRLAAGQSATFQFPTTVESVGRHPVNVTLSYTRDGVRRQVTRTYQPSFGAPANPGEITLTGVDAVSQGGSLELSATASNVGSTEVESVVISTNGSDVGRADYFVGSVDGSDFASFTLSTSVSGNLSTVPVQVSYVVDGAERSYTTDVPVQQAAPEPQPSGGGLPVVPIVGGVVVIGLLVVGYRYLR